MPTSSQTLLDKIWDRHVVGTDDDGRDLLYVDRHLMHEVTSPQAFDGLRQAHRAIRQKQFILAVADHNVATKYRSGQQRESADLPAGAPRMTHSNSMRRIQSGKDSALQMSTLTHNCNETTFVIFRRNPAMPASFT